MLFVFILHYMMEMKMRFSFFYDTTNGKLIEKFCFKMTCD